MLLSLIAHAVLATHEHLEDNGVVVAEESQGLPYIHREKMSIMNFIPRELEFDLRSMIND